MMMSLELAAMIDTSACVTCGAFALRATENYHLSMIFIFGMAFIGLVASLFLKPPASLVSIRKLILETRKG